MRPALTRLALRLGSALLALALIASIAEAQRARGDRNRITRTELDEGGSTIVTARDAVRVLRPQWLQPPRGRQASANMRDEPTMGGGATVVVVYIDGNRQPDLDALATVPALKVVEMRYLDQNRAIQMHGPGHEAGVIEVTTVDKKK
jgi:hypothetical protein